MRDTPDEYSPRVGKELLRSRPAGAGDEPRRGLAPDRALGRLEPIQLYSRAVGITRPQGAMAQRTTAQRTLVHATTPADSGLGRPPRLWARRVLLILAGLLV